MKLMVVLLTAAIAALAIGQAQAVPTLDMLVADLESGDNGARQARARQLLPLRGPEAAWKLLPLLDDERHTVYYTALRVLEDIIHDQVFLQTGEDRDRLEAAIFSLVAPGASDRQKHAGLHLLPYVADENSSLVHLAAMLLTEAWREHARAALEITPTGNALTVLCNALVSADEAFKMDLLRAIRAFDPADEARKIMPLLQDPSTAVRGAALRALARTGDPALVGHARRITDSADTDSAFDAWDGWLRLTDALAARGGHWEQAMRSYREILDTAPHTLIQGGAITGLGRYGDDTSVPVIVAALGRENGAFLEAAALEAFRNLHGLDVRRRLAAAFPELSTPMQAGLLTLFGASAFPEYFDLLAGHVHHEEPVIRKAARRALGQSASPAAAPLFQSILAKTAAPGEDPALERAEALANLHALARRMDLAGDTSGAGAAWLALYEHAEDASLREAALDGIRRNPVPEAFEVVLELLEAGDIESLPVDVMIGIAQNALVAGREEEGRRLMDEIIPRLNTTDAVRRAAAAMRAEGLNPDFARLIGVVNRWYFVGPFPWNQGDGFSPVFIGEPDIDLDAVYEAGDPVRQWRVAESQDVVGLYDLMTIIAPVEYAVAFAYAQIEVEEGGPAQVRVGSDDGVRIWVNGAVVHEHDVDRGYDVDQDIADIILNAGTNDLLVQITQRAGGWAFGLRLTHPDGVPLQFKIAS